MLFNSPIVRVICVLLVILVAGGVLFVLVDADRQEAKRREELVMQYESEKRVYDQKINDLNKQIKVKKEELLAGLPLTKGVLCIGVKASSVGELQQGLSILEPFHFPVTVILDAGLPQEIIRDILDEIREREDICVIPCGDETAMLRLMETEGDIVYPLAYMSGRITEEEKASLASSGFVGFSEDIGYTSTSVKTVVYSDDICALPHIPLGEDNALNAAATDAAGRVRGLFLTVEMENMNKAFTMETATRILGKIKESFTDVGLMDVASVSDYLTLARENAAIREQAKAEFAAFEAERKAEIAECEAEIERIAAKYRWW